MTTTRALTAAPRLLTLDALRGLAIVCMLIAHGMPFLWPTGVSAGVDLASRAVNDVASPLFGLAMGAAAALVWGRDSVARAWPRRVLSDLGRGVVVFAIGMLLVELETWVAIVLQVLGVLMIVGIPLAALAGWAIRNGMHRAMQWWLLAGVTLVLFLLAPWATGVLVPAEGRLPNGTTGGASEIWAALAAGHSYRALSLLPFFALGATIASAGWFERPRRLGLVALPLSLGLALLTGLGAFGEKALSGDVADQFRDLTLVLGALAAISLLVSLGGALQHASRLVADLGTVALSLYVLQILVLSPMIEWWRPWLHSAAWGWAFLAALVIVPSLVMVLWRRTLGPGPVERLVALVTGKGRAT